MNATRAKKMNELKLLQDADERARRYLENTRERRVFPDSAALDGLNAFDEVLPMAGNSEQSTLRLLDDAGSPATVASNGPNYFGFVIGATLPVAAAAERLAISWDQCASSFDNSPVADKIEKVAARWILDALDLPRDSAVGFGTSASACGLACLTAARRALLKRQGWDFDEHGLNGAPEIKVVVSDMVHITVLKSLRMMGFGLANIVRAPVDANCRIDPARLPPLDDKTILCLQAGEVNTGEFDPFVPLIDMARQAGAWVHVDGAFGLWARASESLKHMTEGVEAADSWTSDGHKWLNTPYDGAFSICREADELSTAMNSDAVYSSASFDSQKNLGIEFSRRARGIAIWAALRTLGRKGIGDMVDRHCAQARRLADGLEMAGIKVLNRVVLNQVVARLEDDRATNNLRERAVQTGRVWFGPTVYAGRTAFRLSVSSWRTTDADIDRAIAVLTDLVCGNGQEHQCNGP